MAETQRQRPEVDYPDGPPPQELQVVDEVVGDGAEAKSGMTVSTHYVGVAYSTGEEFDASWNRGRPLDFRLGAGQVIAGWDQGIQGMKVGGRRRITIPPRPSGDSARAAEKAVPESAES